jgi:uncharacterized protein (DUF488 family)
MLLNRQKILLSYIYLSGKIESKTVLTKSVFLLCKEEMGGKEIYDFFPYYFGPYSFSLDRIDIKNLVDRGLITDFPYEIKDEIFAKKILSNLDNKVVYAINHIYFKYGKLKAWEIKNYVYKKFPYFAIRNKNNPAFYSANDPANQQDMQDSKILTIGYEGRSIDRFLDDLIKNNVKVLVDVRNNPRSRKHGFSGNTIKHYAEEVNVEYLSVPELGISSQYRQELNTMDDYAKIFALYRNKVLPNSSAKLNLLKNLIISKKRIALMCFERDYKKCHRSILSEELKNYCNGEYGISHV